MIARNLDAILLIQIMADVATWSKPRFSSATTEMGIPEAMMMSFQATVVALRANMQIKGMLYRKALSSKWTLTWRVMILMINRSHLTSPVTK